jgi:hypothetical protein
VRSRIVGGFLAGLVLCLVLSESASASDMPGIQDSIVETFNWLSGTFVPALASGCAAAYGAGFMVRFLQRVTR